MNAKAQTLPTPRKAADEASTIFIVSHGRTGQADPNGHSLVLPEAGAKDPYWEVMRALKTFPGETATILGRVKFTDADGALGEMLHQKLRKDSEVSGESALSVRLRQSARDNVNDILARNPGASYVEWGPVGHARQTQVTAKVDKDPPALMSDRTGTPAIIVSRDELTDAIAAVRTGSATQSPTANLLSNLTTAIAQRQWEKDAGGRLKETGEIKSGVEALEALRDGFGTGSHRKLTLDPQKLQTLTVTGGHLLGREFAEVVAKVAATSRLRDASFQSAKQAKEVYAREAKDAREGKSR